MSGTKQTNLIKTIAVGLKKFPVDCISEEKLMGIETSLRDHAHKERIKSLNQKLRRSLKEYEYGLPKNTSIVLYSEGELCIEIQSGSGDTQFLCQYNKVTREAKFNFIPEALYSRTSEQTKAVSPISTITSYPVECITLESLTEIVEIWKGQPFKRRLFHNVRQYLDDYQQHIWSNASIMFYIKDDWLIEIVSGSCEHNFLCQYNQTSMETEFTIIPGVLYKRKSFKNKVPGFSARLSREEKRMFPVDCISKKNLKVIEMSLRDHAYEERINLLNHKLCQSLKEYKNGLPKNTSIVLYSEGEICIEIQSGLGDTQFLCQYNNLTREAEFSLIPEALYSRTSAQTTAVNPISTITSYRVQCITLASLTEIGEFWKAQPLDIKTRLFHKVCRYLDDYEENIWTNASITFYIKDDWLIEIISGSCEHNFLCQHNQTSMETEFAKIPGTLYKKKSFISKIDGFLARPKTEMHHTFPVECISKESIMGIETSLRDHAHKERINLLNHKLCRSLKEYDENGLWKNTSIVLYSAGEICIEIHSEPGDTQFLCQYNNLTREAEFSLIPEALYSRTSAQTAAVSPISTITSYPVQCITPGSLTKISGFLKAQPLDIKRRLFHKVRRCLDDYKENIWRNASITFYIKDEWLIEIISGSCEHNFLCQYNQTSMETEFANIPGVLYTRKSFKNKIQGFSASPKIGKKKMLPCQIITLEEFEQRKIAMCERDLCGNEGQSDENSVQLRKQFQTLRDHINNDKETDWRLAKVTIYATDNSYITFQCKTKPEIEFICQYDADRKDVVFKNANQKSKNKFIFL